LTTFLWCSTPTDRAAERARRLPGRLLQHHLHLLAAGLVQELGVGGVVGQIDGERLQRFLDRVVAVVGDGRDQPAAEVLHRQALDQVVDVGDGEAQVDAGVAFDLPLPDEVADAGRKQHRPLDRQRGHGGGRGAGRTGVRRPGSQR
jgi:hypothetical protein